MVMAGRVVLLYFTNYQGKKRVKPIKKVVEKEADKEEIQKEYT